MPGPPPPPPPGGPPPMMPPPPVAFNPAGGDNRGALLNSIRKGTKLKKTVTNDKSAPAIGGKVSSSNNNANASSPGKANGPVSGGIPNGLGGLFAGGMPKLNPIGKSYGSSINASQSSLSSNNRVQDSPSSKSFSSKQIEIQRQIANYTVFPKRGPPPPTPTRSYNNLSEETSRLQLTPKNESSNGFHLNENATTPYQHGLHRKTQSNVNISTLDSTDSTYNNNSSNRPVINHGKPNLAPKPPILNGKPAAPPKKLLINGKPVGRAQSMRSPRSPSPQSPDNNNPDNKFATARNLSQVLNQSLGNLSQVKSRPLLNGRPSAPPPSIPNTPPPPPSKMVKPPSQAPPPPPNMIPQAPNHAPPPPPHRTGPLVPSRAPPSVPGANAPPPPPRHSSIRDLPNSKRNSSCDLESRFTFKKVSEFPKPPAFRNVSKVYTSRQVGNKQQAPLPPSQVQLTNRLWESSTC